MPFDKLVAFQDWVNSAISTAIAAVNSTISGLRVSPAGTVVPFAGITVPTGWLLCDGSAVQRSTYANLFAAITQSATVTLTIASPCVITWTNHPLVVGDKVSFETTGALPTGLSVGTNYFVSAVLSANTFKVSATLDGADVNTSGTQSGTHTCRFNPHGCGNGTTTFTLPDLTGRVPAGKEATATRLTVGNSGVRGNVLGVTGGDERLHSHTHGPGTLSTAGHGHTASGVGLVGNNLANGTTRAVGTGDGVNSGYFQDVQVTVNAAGAIAVNAGATAAQGSGASQNVQPTIVLNYIIAI